MRIVLISTLLFLVVACTTALPTPREAVLERELLDCIAARASHCHELARALAEREGIVVRAVLHRMGFACTDGVATDCTLTPARETYARFALLPGSRRAVVRITDRSSQYVEMCMVCRTP